MEKRKGKKKEYKKKGKSKYDFIMEVEGNELVLIPNFRFGI
mgnify:CR=1 FL=1